MKFLKEHSLFICLFVLCAVLRFIPLFDYQFTYDELSGLERTQFTSFGELIEKGVKIDAHPAFVQVLIFYLTQFFGYKTWIIKLPFLLMSLGAMVYGYAIGCRHFTKQVGLVISAFLAYSLLFVFYAPIARMYISGVFFSLGLLYYFFELVFSERTSLRNYILFGLFAWLSALNQHINSLFALTVYVAGLLLLKKENYKAYIITGLITVAAYLPHLQVSLYQLGVGGIGRDKGGWLEKPEASVIFDFIKILLGTGKSYLFVLIMAIGAGMSSRQIRFSKKQWFLLFIFIINFLIVYLYSVYRAAIYQHSVMLFSGMAFLIFTASFLDFTKRWLSHLSLFLLVSLLLYKTYIKKEYLSQAVKTVFEYQFERTSYYKTVYGDTSVYPLFFDADNIMKKIYCTKYSSMFECKVSSDTVYSSMQEFSRFVSGLKCNYLALASAMPAQQAVARQYFPYLLENTQTQGINYKLYSKVPSDKSRQVDDDVVLTSSEPANKGVFSYSENFISSGNIALDSLNEFPFTIRADYSEAVKEEGNVVLLTTKLKFNTISGKRIEGCININNTNNQTNYGYAARPASDFVFSPDSTVTIYTDYFAGTSHARVAPDSQLAFYGWNRWKESATLEAINIKVIDYWHWKWHFWD